MVSTEAKRCWYCNLRSARAGHLKTRWNSSPYREHIVSKAAEAWVRRGAYQNCWEDCGDRTENAGKTLNAGLGGKDQTQKNCFGLEAA